MIRTSIQHFIEKSFSDNEARIAIQDGSCGIPYEELRRRYVQIAAGLSGWSGDTPAVIAVCFIDKTLYIPAVLGILTARAIYLPIDAAYPPERIRYILRAAGAVCILTDRPTRAAVFPDDKAAPDLFFLLLEAMSSTAGETACPIREYHQDDPVYIYFTSGSTGDPRPVLGRNESLLNFILWEIRTFRTGAMLRAGQLIHVGFDAWLRDIFVPLLSGGCICIPPSGKGQLQEDQWTRWVEDERVQLIHCVPSFFKLLNNDRITAGSYPDLRLILLSGERLSPLALERWYRRIGDRVRLVNLYGTTETTMIKTYYEITPDDTRRQRIPAGIPIDNTAVLVLDEQQKVCPRGEEGEVYIQSGDLSLGYLGDDRLNAEKFLPMAGGAARMYRTGDWGRILPDGNLELLGRKDRQVKVRGVRIDLTEIERAACRCAPVKEIMAMARTSEEGELFLCLYYISGQVMEEEMRVRLLEQLPGYMLPSLFIRMDSFPLLPNGKTDVNRFPDPKKRFRPAADRPQDAMGMRIAGCWARTLDVPVEGIGMCSNFFRFGGNSIQLLQLLAAMTESTGCRIPLEGFLKDPSVAYCTVYVSGAAESVLDDLPPAPVSGSYAVTATQRRLFTRWRNDRNNLTFNMPSVLEICGEIDYDELSAIFSDLLKRHEAFRTSFLIENGEVRQSVTDRAELIVEPRFAETNDLYREIAGCIRPFDLNAAPLIRAFLLITPDNRNILVIDIHHIVIDAISMRVLESEIAALFHRRPLSPPAITHKDFTEWLCHPARKDRLERQKEYWLKEFATLPPPLVLPFDHERPGIKTTEGGIHRSRLGPQRTLLVRAAAQQHSVSVFTLLLSSYFLLLHKLGDNKEITVGIPASGRSHHKVASVPGLFVGELVMRQTIDDELTVSGLIAAVHRKGISCFENQDFQYKDLLEVLGMPAPAPRNPLFDTWFTYQQVESTEICLRDDLKLVKFISDNHIALFDLSFRVYDIDNDLEFRFEYWKRLFEPASVERIARFQGIILDEMTSGPDLPLGRLSSFFPPADAELLQQQQDVPCV